ncbi:hypothetical protein [Streptomyces sp. NPDC056683]
MTTDSSDVRSLPAPCMAGTTAPIMAAVRYGSSLNAQTPRP